MSRAVIVTSHVEGLKKIKTDRLEYDKVICADGGLLIAEKLGINADYLIGDYDSMDVPEGKNIIRLPMEKDLTDTEAALRFAISKGFDSITILGGLGGRFDHTMGNIGMLALYTPKLKKITLVDGQNKVFMLLPGKHIINKENYKYMGVISYTPASEGLTLSGVKYPLKDFKLTNDTSLGVSNEITHSEAEISFSEGMLLIIQSNDD